MTIKPRNIMDTLVGFTPALSNMWEFEFIEEPTTSGLDSFSREVLKNLKYLITAIEIEGWSFKYDFIPAKQRNVITEVTRPTKITINVSDTLGLGVLNSLITVITNHLFSTAKSTFITGPTGKNLGNFKIRIINPYYMGNRINDYSPFSDGATDSKFISFEIECKNIHIGGTPPLVLNRKEAKPIEYSIDFYCDNINFISSLTVEPSDIKTTETIEKETQANPYPYGTANIITTPYMVDGTEVLSPGIQSQSSKVPNSMAFDKFLQVTFPVFSNLFYMDFDFGKEKQELVDLTSSVKKNNVFNDVMIESVTIDGYKIEYSFSESVLKNLFTKISRPRKISLSVIDNNKLSFLNALYTVVKTYYYNEIAGYFVNGAAGKNMNASFVLYYNSTAKEPISIQYFIYAEGIKIEKLPTLSLNYTNSEVIRYSVDLVCDSINFFNKEGIDRTPGLVSKEM